MARQQLILFQCLRHPKKPLCTDTVLLQGFWVQMGQKCSEIKYHLGSERLLDPNLRYFFHVI